MKKCAPFLFFILLLPLAACGQKVREPVFAGQFYEKNPEALSRQIELFLNQARGEPRKTEGLHTIIVPHAGYVCSGPVAATAYRLVQGLEIETVVIIGTSHQAQLRDCSIYPEGGYQTPLGIALVDAELSGQISRLSGFSFYPGAHQAEHSIEVQIPFIQKVLPRAKIVPILMGRPSPQTISTLAESLVQSLKGKKSLVVVSTDLSHYYPKDKANAVDGETLALIKNCQTDRLAAKLQRGENIMCGGAGVVSALLYAQGLGEVEIDILHYADSSSTCGSPSQVVGYAAAAIFAHPKEKKPLLSETSKKELLELARTAIERYVNQKEITVSGTQNHELLVRRGVFVTLKKNKTLRGCIGSIEPVVPLHQAAIQAAIAASSRDPRFDPVTPAELDEIEIEISVLSPLTKISDPSLVEVGKHGLFVSRGGRSGLLLPQVPVENGWPRRIFLQQACLKAGLPKDAWKSGSELYVFEALVFQ